MTAEELDLLSVQYTDEFDAERPALYANNHEREVRVSERQQAFVDGFKKALGLVIENNHNPAQPSVFLVLSDEQTY